MIRFKAEVLNAHGACAVNGVFCWACVFLKENMGRWGDDNGRYMEDVGHKLPNIMF